MGYPHPPRVFYYYSRYDFCRNTDKRMGQSCEKVLGEKCLYFNNKINVSTKMTEGRLTDYPYRSMNTYN